MTTSLMEIYSVEIGDILYLNGDLYTVVDWDYADDDEFDVLLTLVDDEGNRKQLRGPISKEVNLVVSEYV
jgi:hypothetical protein